MKGKLFRYLNVLLAILIILSSVPMISFGNHEEHNHTESIHLTTTPMTLVEKLFHGYESIFSDLEKELTNDESVSLRNQLEQCSDPSHNHHDEGQSGKLEGDYYGKTVKVAIFDTGINALSDQLDLAGGVSFVDGVESYADDNGHGTKMAEILTATMNDNEISSDPTNIEIYSVKILNKNGIGRDIDVLKAVEWAIDNNIRIITMSFGSPTYSNVLKEAIDKAINHNILVIAASGNGGQESIYYPAAFDKVIAVGAVDSDNKLAEISNYGYGLDIVASGSEPISNNHSKNLEMVQGTSVAVQKVAASAALLWSHNHEMTTYEIKFLLFENTLKYEEEFLYGQGLLNYEQSYLSLINRDYLEGNSIYSVKSKILNTLDIENEVFLTAQACVHTYVDYGGYEGSHPHNRYKVCSKCSATAYTGATKYISTCCSCAGHTYSNGCDSSCNRCGASRSVSHSYSNGCDTSCDVCGASRSASHSYSNSCDTSCNICGASRSASHSYSNGCDTSCNVCGASRSPSHSYTYGCSTSCSVCGASRSASHNFVGATCQSRSSCSYCGTLGSYGTHSYVDRGNYQGSHPHKGYNVCSISGCTSTQLNGTEKYVSTCKCCTNQHPLLNRTCTQPYVCSNGCGYTYGVPKGHEYSGGTCIKAAICTSCGAVGAKNATVHQRISALYETHKSNGNDYDYRLCLDCGVETYGYESACNCHTHNFSTKVVSPTHTSTGHSYYWKCSCNETSGSGYQTVSTCTSCTTPPSVTFVTPQMGHFFSETSGVLMPKINVRDNENDTLTCKYFVNCNSTPTTTQTVSNTSVNKIVEFNTGFNVSNLNEGNCKIRAEVSDGISPVGFAEVNIIVDKTNPILQVSEIQAASNGFTIYVSGYDAFSGLHDLPYEISIAELGYNSGWSSNNTLIPNGAFVPNTSYTIKIRVKDAVNHILESTQVRSTLACVPQVEVNSIDKQSAVVNVIDSNPNSTLYEVKVGNQYVNSSGSLIGTPTEISLSSKSIVLNGLTPGTSYTVTAKAKSNDGSLTPSSESVNFNTKPNPPQSPTGIQISNISQTSAVVEWNASIGATSYALNVNGVDILAEYQDLNYFIGQLTPNTDYVVKVKASNTGGASDWSAEFSFKTKPILGISASAQPGLIKLTWEAVEGITNYEILVNDIDLHQVSGTSLDIIANESDVFYSFQIRGKNANGAGAYTNPISTYSLAKVPSGLTVSGETSSSLTLGWEANGNPESIQYQIEAVESEAGLAKENGLKKTNNWTYNLTDQITGLKLNQEYLVTVIARNSVGIATTEIISCVGRTLDVAPESPVNIISTSTDSNITLKWDGIHNATAYKIYRDDVVIEANAPQNTFVDTGSPALTSNTEYTYKIVAVNAFGESAPSVEVSKRTLPQLPLIPSNVTTTSTKTSITLLWDVTPNTTGYEVEFNGSIKSAGIVNQFVMNGLEPGENYTYRVRSRNEGGKSSWSALEVVQTALGTPNVPSEVIASPSEDKIILSWLPSTNAEGYQIELNGVINGTTNTTSYELLNLTPETTYSIRIKAFNAHEESDWTALQEIATLNNIVGAPFFTAVTSGFDSIVIEWNAIQDAIDYVVKVNDIVIADHVQETTYAVESLEKGSQYSVEVGVNKEGAETLYGHKQSVYTLPDSLDFENQYATPVSVYLDWPQVLSGTGYEIEINGQLVNVGNTNQYLSDNEELLETNQYRIRAYNQGGFGEWSEIETVVLPKMYDNVPTNIHIESAEHNAIVTWDVNEAVDHYEYILGTSDPVVIESAYIALTELTSNTEYTISIRSLMDEEGLITSDWSEIITFNTLSNAPDAPEEVTFITESDRITLNWTEVIGATGYEVMVDNTIVPVGLVTTYLDAGLLAESEHTYKVRSIISGIKSAWTQEQTAFTQIGIPGVPTNIVGNSTVNSVNFIWSPVEGATSYVIEVDGVQELVTTENTEYTFTELSEATIIKIRISAIVDALQSPFSTAVSCSSGLSKPENLASETIGTSATLSWNAVLGATLYEIEADGIVIGTTSEPTFLIENIEAGTLINVRIRGKNAFKAKSDWTEMLEVKAAPLTSTIGVFVNEIFDITLRADQIDDFSKYTFTIEYDAEMLRVLDLYSLTEAIELGMGNVPGTDLRVISYEPGKIVFKMSTAVLPGKVWSGVVTVIELEALMTGPTTIIYRIQ